MKGLVHVYTGDGKGKTTAAIGLGIRACGHGMKVLMIQFLKSMPTGEVTALERLAPLFELHRGAESRNFTWNMNVEERKAAIIEQKELFDYTIEQAASDRWDMIILDEIMAAVDQEMISPEDVISMIKARPDRLEVVLTGRKAPGGFTDIADYVSDIRCFRHPMEKGISPRRGIEF